MRVLVMFAVLAVIVACRGDVRAPRAPAITAPVAIADAAIAVAVAVARPPAGTAELVPVPDAIARQVALREVAHGLQRPVLVVVAPGDVRGRLFVVEQRGRIRIVDHGALAKRPFFTIKN